MVNFHLSKIIENIVVWLFYNLIIFLNYHADFIYRSDKAELIFLGQPFLMLKKTDILLPIITQIKIISVKLQIRHVTL